ncbi:MAG: electron transfer flavoprotein subunit beta/FixA family protein [Pseudomonadota bacterium]
MNIIVTIKQVPDTLAITVDPETGTLNRKGVPSIINPEDKNAIEAALMLKRKHGGSVTAISMGPHQAQDVLREALCLGVDRAILLTDELFAGADTLATAYTLSSAIKKIGNFDLIIAGHQAIDGDTAQVGPQLAGFLNIPQITNVVDMKISASGNHYYIEAKSKFGHLVRKVRAKLPSLITVVKETNRPKYTTINGILNGYRKREIECWNCDDIKAAKHRIGLIGSPTSVLKTKWVEHKRKGKTIKGSPEKIADEIIKFMEKKEIKGAYSI